MNFKKRPKKKFKEGHHDHLFTKSQKTNPAAGVLKNFNLSAPVAARSSRAEATVALIHGMKSLLASAFHGYSGYWRSHQVLHEPMSISDVPDDLLMAALDFVDVKQILTVVARSSKHMRKLARYTVVIHIVCAAHVIQLGDFLCSISILTCRVCSGPGLCREWMPWRCLDVTFWVTICDFKSKLGGFYQGALAQYAQNCTSDEVHERYMQVILIFRSINAICPCCERHREPSCVASLFLLCVADMPVYHRLVCMTISATRTGFDSFCASRAV